MGVPKARHSVRGMSMARGAVLPRELLLLVLLLWLAACPSLTAAQAVSLAAWRREARGDAGDVAAGAPALVEPASSLPSAADVGAKFSAPPAGARVVRGEFLVTLRGDVRPREVARLAAAVRALGGSVLLFDHRHEGGASTGAAPHGVFAVALPPPPPPPRAPAAAHLALLRLLAGSDAVEALEPNTVVAATTTTDIGGGDSSSSSNITSMSGGVHVQGAPGGTPAPPWGLDRLDQVSAALDGAYAYAGRGAQVCVYVVDTGVRANHAELVGRVLSPGFSALTDDGNTADDHGHGTHVAGTIAGTTYGVAKKATIVPVKVLDAAAEGDAASVIAGVTWAMQHRAAAAGCPKGKVINLSLSGPASAAVNAVVQRAVAGARAAVVASAGNGAGDACGSSPSGAPAAVTAAATGRGDARAAFSASGACVDVFAPGEGVVSAWATGRRATARLGGTSMAAAHASGALARLAGAGACANATTGAFSPQACGARLRGLALRGRVAGAGAGSRNLLLHLGPTDA